MISGRVSARNVSMRAEKFNSDDVLKTIADKVRGGAHSFRARGAKRVSRIARRASRGRCLGRVHRVAFARVRA